MESTIDVTVLIRQDIRIRYHETRDVLRVAGRLSTPQTFGSPWTNELDYPDNG
jgi:hypothetical protein